MNGGAREKRATLLFCIALWRDQMSLRAIWRRAWPTVMIKKGNIRPAEASEFQPTSWAPRAFYSKHCWEFNMYTLDAHGTDEIIDAGWALALAAGGAARLVWGWPPLIPLTAHLADPPSAVARERAGEQRVLMRASGLSCCHHTSVATTNQ